MVTDQSDTLEENTTDTSSSFTRRSALSALGTAGIGLAGIGAFAGTAAAWGEFGVDFKGCSAVWLIVSEADLDYEQYDDREEPLKMKVVVERNGEAECETVRFTEETTTTVPGQYGDYPLVKFDGGDKILAVIKYNHNDIANCYVENPNQCAQTPNTPDWRDADCADDLKGDLNQSCADRDKLTLADPEDGPGNSSQRSGARGGPSR